MTQTLEARSERLNKLQKIADEAWDAANVAHFKKDYGQEQVHTLEALEHQRQVRELLK